MLLEFSFSFVIWIIVALFENVNCPPARAKPKIIRRNAIPRRDFIHLAESRLQLLCDHAKRRSSVDHPTDYHFILDEDALERRRTWSNLRYQIALQSVKHNPSKFEHGVLISPGN